MKKINYFLLLILSLAVVPSCLVDDGAMTDDWGNGPNLAGFEENSMTIGGIANGDTYDFNIPMKVAGPTKSDVSQDVTVTVEADASSTAIEGVHYTIPNKTITLSADNNLLGLLPIKLLTEGIEAPLAESPVLVLKAVSATGADNVIANGKKLTIDLNYLCNSELAGTYDATMVWTNYDGSQTTREFVDVISETGVGQYRTSEVGHWTQDDLGGTPGFTFFDVCEVITIPGQNLVDTYSNWVEGTTKGSYNKETGVLHVEYSICVSTGCRQYVVDYVRR